MNLQTTIIITRILPKKKKYKNFYHLVYTTHSGFVQVSIII